MRFFFYSTESSSLSIGLQHALRPVQSLCKIGQFFSFTGARWRLKKNQEQCAYLIYMSVTAPCCSSFFYVFPSPVSVLLPPGASVYKQSPHCSAAALCMCAHMWAYESESRVLHSCACSVTTWCSCFSYPNYRWFLPSNFCIVVFSSCTLA